MAGVVNGTSVLGLAFDKGVIVAADQLVSYGSMARFRNCDRILKVNERTVVAASGDYADYQFMERVISQKQIEEEEWNDGFTLNPAALHSWLSRVAYNRRSRFEPLWCSWLVAGLQPSEDGAQTPYLGFVDKLGTSYSSNVIATGFGSYLATPLFRELTEINGKTRDQLPTEEEARNLVTKCMEVLYYRDARSLPKYKIAVIKPVGVTIEGPVEFKGDWQVASQVAGF
ncbi:Proteasome subunit beta type-4, partial [Fragariocoptes setiger]